MDLLPPPTDAPASGAGGSGRGLRRGVGFRSLKLVSVAMDEPLPVDPVGATYGRLPNGLTYYVRSNPKPRMRAALSLAVKVGSVLLNSVAWITSLVVASLIHFARFLTAMLCSAVAS
jgi:hypothetical protein